MRQKGGYQPTHGGDSSNPPRGGSGGSEANSKNTANDAALEYVSRLLQHGRFTGQIVLHVNGGIIRKTETRDFLTTEELLTGKHVKV